MSTPDTMSAMEDRLRAALTARAEQVRPEHLAPLAPVVRLRPRWQSPWVLLATAAVVLLVLGVVLQGLGRDTRSDDVAPSPDEPRIELPPDVGRGWAPNDVDRPARPDLDGDGEKEEITFRGERTEEFDGRYRLETTLSSTGEEVYGIVEVGTTVATNVLAPIDADGDGDQELVLYYDDADVVGGGGHPLVLDLRDGLLVQAVPEDPDLLARGNVPVPGSTTEFYEMVRIHDYWFEDGQLWSSRSQGAYASGNMMRLTPRTYVVDAWEWTLGDDGVLRHGDPVCLLQSFDSTRPCGLDPVDTVASLPVERAAYAGTGEAVNYDTGYRFSGGIEALADPSLVIEGEDGRTLQQELDVRDPLIGTVQPTSVFADGASLVVTSASDPTTVQVLTQDADRMVVMDPVGEIDLTNSDTQRTWLTDAGGVLSAVAAEEGTWTLWQWVMVSRTEIAALPWGTVCIDDVDTPTAIRAC